MRLHDILAAAENVQATDNLPYYLSLLAIFISLIALVTVFRAASHAAGKNHTQVPAPPATPSEVMAPQAPAAQAPAATPAPAAESQSIPPEIVAVIAAAVASMTGGSHRVVSIKPMSTSWERAGRQSVLTSHRIR